MAELADAQDLGSCGVTRGGSTPPSRSINCNCIMIDVQKNVDRVLYPGSFDPITYGHIDVINRATKIFPTVIIGVTNNPQKKHFFTLKERVYLISSVLKNKKNVIVKTFKGLVVDFMREEKIYVLLRGIRTISDFEYEFHMALANRTMAPDIETIFIMSSEQNEFVRSSLIKEIGYFKGDLTKFVPTIVADYLKKKFQRK